MLCLCLHPWVVTSMAGKAPLFWWEKPDWRTCVLAPLSWIYGAVARHRMLAAVPPKVAAPVLCIGNYTVGGAGKTPTAIALARAARAKGLKPAIVSRGYGGSYKGLHLVDPDHDPASLVGDEPLLLAQHAPVALSAERFRAAERLIELGSNFIIMDDGFQSARLYADYALLVVDASRGIGNGCVIPAGPLRAPFPEQMGRTDALLVIGRGDAADFVVRQAARAARPVFHAHLQPSYDRQVAGQCFLAFAGIGNPDKFYASVREAGGKVIEMCSFPDHHPYSADEVRLLGDMAEKKQLGLITTAKDQVRLATMPDIEKAFLEKIAVLDVELQFDRSDAAGMIIDSTIERFDRRQQG